MYLSSPLETLHQCLSSAQFVDMNDITERRRKSDFKPYSGEKTNHTAYQNWIQTSFEEYNRRPHAHELIVEAMFPQTWSDTSLGFGGVGGQAFTTAYTTIISCDLLNDYCVYFGGRFAYNLDMTKCDIELIRKDINLQFMAKVSDKSRYLKK